MKHKMGDMLTIRQGDLYYELLWTVFINYVELGKCLNIHKSGKIVDAFNDAREDWMNAVHIAFPDTKGYLFSLGSFINNAIPFESAIKLIITSNRSKK